MNFQEIDIKKYCLRALAMLAASVLLLYGALVLYVFSSFDQTQLIGHYITDMPRDNDFSEIPIFRPIKDAYWRMRGERRVIEGAREGQNALSTIVAVLDSVGDHTNRQKTHYLANEVLCVTSGQDITKASKLLSAIKKHDIARWRDDMTFIEDLIDKRSAICG